MGSETRIPGEVAAVIGFYVYALRDPRDVRVFYVGKGVGDRINAHAREAGADPEGERAKLRTINDIESDGRELDLLFLRTGLDEQTALTVEQAVIDAFAADGHPLTNLVRGHHSGQHGLASLPAVIARHRALPCPPIPGPLIMVKIQRGWHADSTPGDIYDMTRGHWKIAGWVRERARYCLGVAHGIVRGAYRIEGWFESEQPWDAGRDRWGFTGAPAAELAHVVGTEVRDVFGGRVMYRRYLDGYPGSPS
ncbi:LEM-3-like GIY-YIG domain-containing protein [Microbacterium enclense]|uniref:LEM-3-like GIY-YIG domain-containing protein n=1 Tax=Microbacterium enclense TaxID=993073 RepID=UPI003419CD29